MPCAPSISVIVPTQRRPEPLVRAVHSLFAQEGLEPAALEVVVVDNDVTPSGEGAVDALRAVAPMPIAYVHEPRPGVATARNAGVAAARAPWLAFLDDDQEAVPRWLAELSAVRDRLGAQAVFCPVRAALPAEVRTHRRYYERFFTHDGPAGEQRVRRGYGAGCSLVERAALPDRLAPFATAFDLTGGEDDELFVRMLERGAVLGWTPAVWVWEHPSPDRINLRFALRRAFTYGQGSTVTPLMHDPPRRGRALASQAVGLAQTLAMGAASAALWAIRQPDRAFAYDKAARGLGKMLVSDRFQLKFYGLAPGERAGRAAQPPAA